MGKTQPKSENTNNVLTENFQASFYQQKESAEIDLRDLALALWKGKIVIATCTLIFTIISVVYALSAQEWWSSRATITLPQKSGISKYEQQVKQFQSVFDVYQQDGTVILSEELESLVDLKTIFELYIEHFNSNVVKQRFFESSSTFNKMVQELNAATDQNNQFEPTTIYKDWYGKIKSVRSDSIDVYSLKFESVSSEISYLLLMEYISFVNDSIRNDALLNLRAKISNKKSEITHQYKALSNQAKLKLNTELERAKYSFEIAKSAGINNPALNNLGDDDYFSINWGSEALEAKINVLKGMDNLSLVEPRLHKLQIKLEQIDNTVITETDFETFRYLDEPKKALSRDKPKRAIITILGFLLGGILGVAVVMAKYFYIRND